MCPVAESQFFAVVSVETRVNDVCTFGILARPQEVNDPMRQIPLSPQPYDVVAGGWNVFTGHLPWSVPARLTGPLEA